MKDPRVTALLPCVGAYASCILSSILPRGLQKFLPLTSLSLFWAQHRKHPYIRDGPTTTTTTIFRESFASDATPNRHLMAHQMKNLRGFSGFHCVEGAFGASSGGTPEMKNGAPRDELKMVVVVVGPSLNIPC